MLHKKRKTGLFPITLPKKHSSHTKGEPACMADSYVLDTRIFPFRVYACERVSSMLFDVCIMRVEHVQDAF